MNLKLGLRLTLPLIAILVSSEFFLCCAIVQDIPMVIRNTFNPADVHREIQNIEPGTIFKPHRNRIDWLHEHGMSVKQTGTSKCSACHGTDLDGGLAEVSCYTCHGNKWDSPHPSHWIRDHGQHIDKHDVSKCNQCHGSNNKNAKSVISCNTCHGNYAELQQTEYIW